MSLFETIKSKIFGHKAAAATPEAGGIGSIAPTATDANAGTPTPATTAGAAPSQPVDVEAVLKDMASKNPQQLNWQTSIVDLMKLLGLDSSFANRKELAGELGYTGSTEDSASMNIWLQKQVMQKLAENGGKVPESLKG
ncbi:DUF3597 domain-containing protein [Roseomonas sp. KE2513]|uniref:DUF3597 domain-containing protein n=1 Tax=Roseomonas sp. KE2513 TaxID=2479202 RepID=UPI0018E03637|nr:DUF3597 domain-containing protein [Roseomonas sp. KE2513]MBI0536279.1 DUF3597 domain-containing protein [Roseomonas sp. KE2513]